jgi:8-oxo-dGTP diphosphatase
MKNTDPILEVDVVALAIRDGRLQVLLVRRANEPFGGQWALPGVRLAIEERLADAARRALAERTGLAIAYLEQLYTFDGPDRDPRGPTISVAYYALLPIATAADIRPGRAVDEVAWWSVDACPPLAFDHAQIVDVARGRVAAKVEYAPIAFTVLPTEFTMRDLRTVHELLTGRPYAHQNNFARQMSARWNLIETGHLARGRGRPAMLYRLRSAADRAESSTAPLESSTSKDGS